MNGERLSEVVVKDGVEYFIQESREGPKRYICMTRRKEDVLDCEEQSVQQMPKQKF